MSLSQTVPIRPGAGNPTFFADGTVTVSGNRYGFTVSNASGASAQNAALRGSVTGSRLQPLAGWDAQIATQDTQPHRIRILVINFGGPSPVQVFDDQSIIQDPGNPNNFLLDPSPGTVSLLVDLANAPTFGNLDTAVASSALLNLLVGSTNPGFFVISDAAPWTTSATYTPALADNSVLGLATVFAATQGGTVYVPDYARRVMVALMEDPEGQGQFRVPIAGPPVQQIVFYDDNGRVVGAMTQGGTTQQPVGFLEVPASAVMMSVYGATSVNPQTAMIHWRIAP